MHVTEGDSLQDAIAGVSAPRSASKSSEIRISVAGLKDYVEDWNLESQLRQHTQQSVHSRKDRIVIF